MQAVSPDVQAGEVRGGGMIRQHSQLIQTGMRVMDLMVTVLAWAVCYAVLYTAPGLAAPSGARPSFRAVADVAVISLLLELLLFGRMGMYQPRRLQSLAAEFWDIVKACGVVWGLVVISNHFIHTAPVSRRLLGMFLVVWSLLLTGSRGSARLLLRFLRRRGKNVKTAAIVGAGRLGQKLLQTLRDERWTGYQVLYFVADTGIGRERIGVPVRGPIERVDEILAAEPVDVVFLTLSEAEHEKLSEVLEKLTTSIVSISVVPDLLRYYLLNYDLTAVGSLPIVNITHSRQSGLNAVVKRLFDVAGALVALILCAPVMLLTALAVRLSGPGPVFYRQRRASLGGKPFEMIKFRSMRPGSDSTAPEQWSTPEDDPRITPVGRIIRKLNLDELPQLFNVLRGDMSLVGPRPELPEYVERFAHQVPRYILRHHVKAGITGWAQVQGFRGRTSLRKRIQYDLDYITRWSFGFDLWILLLTPLRAVFHGPSRGVIRRSRV